MTFILTEPAEHDLRSILRQTSKMFGPRQVEIYGAIIRRAILLVAAAPDRPGSVHRPEVGPGVRLFHIGLAASRRGAASHCLYYASGKSSANADATIILRILHEKMEPRHRVARTLAVFGKKTRSAPQDDGPNGSS